MNQTKTIKSTKKADIQTELFSRARFYEGRLFFFLLMDAALV